jgi:hypothetical protein
MQQYKITLPYFAFGFPYQNCVYIFVISYARSTCTTVQVYSRPSALMETSSGGLSVIKGYFDEVLPYRRSEEEQFVRTGRGRHAHSGQRGRHDQSRRGRHAHSGQRGRHDQSRFSRRKPLR